MSTPTINKGTKVSVNPVSHRVGRNSEGGIGIVVKKKQKLEKKDNKKNAKEKPKWMYERPSDAELKKPKKWNGNDWWYCSAETGGKCDGVYHIHKP